jgi:O-methyltransferase
VTRVSWREAVNKRLVGATGYRIVKARSAAAAPPAPKPAAKPKPKPKKKPLRRYYDDEARETILAVKPWTMTSYDRIFALIVATRYVVASGIEGDVVECGVWRGGSMQAVARTLLGLGAADRDLHLFDTFEGMPPPTEEDRRIKGGPTAEEMLETQPKTGLVWAIADLDDVQAGMATNGYPGERVHYHPGRVQDTIPGEAPDRIALLRLDTDWYESTKHELEHLYDRLVPGGVLIIDDYDYWAGSRKAVDEFVEATGARLLLVPIDTGRIAVKP